MDRDEVLTLMADLESDRVERTVSLSNTDKFAQAICAFANDMPHHRQPGSLFVGVKDDGGLSGAAITDQLLQNLAAIRSDGNVQPLPAMNPGGLFGDLTPEQFPRGTAYRNPVLAEAARTLGFVNRYGRGIAIAQAELKRNDSPEIRFELGSNHFLTIVPRRP